jgi:hypothetical protein
MTVVCGWVFARRRTVTNMIAAADAADCCRSVWSVPRRATIVGDARPPERRKGLTRAREAFSLNDQARTR